MRVRERLNPTHGKSLVKESHERRRKGRDGSRPVLRLAIADYSDCALNVLQLLMSPEAKPALNQRWRCAEVPWVNESGTA